MFFRRCFGISLLILTIFGIVGCQTKAAGPPPRYAIVAFENISGDPSLDWTGHAASEYLSYSLAGAVDGTVLTPEAIQRRVVGLGADPHGAPGSFTQRPAALLAGATRLISGTVEKSGNQVRLTATEEDLETHQTLRIVEALGPRPLPAIANLARVISPKAASYLTNDPEVLRLYVTGLEKAPPDAVASFEQALGRDPNYGPAWAALANLKNAQGDHAGALEEIAQAAGRKIDPLDRANLDLIRATIANDRGQQVGALRRVAELSAADTGLWRSLAELEAAEGRFADSARDWQKLMTLVPLDSDAVNQLGYSRAWSGDMAGALAALKEYARQKPADPNPFDSTGDVDYMYRKFADAASNYLQAHAKSPEFQSGGDLYKAAWAQFLAGDKTKADANFRQFRVFREKAGAVGLDLFEGDWLYRTGRRSEAMALLRNAPRAAPVSAQLAIWDLLAGDRAAAVKEFAGVAAVPSAAVLVAKFVSMPSATAAEWKTRADRLIQGTGAEPVRRLALAYALILDGKKDAARAAMEKVVAASPATDFFSRAVLAKLKGEEPKLALLPDASSFNQMRALAD